jgi:single-strand DNA-binding protein
MINRVLLKGNLGSNPEFKITQDGIEVASFSLATSFNWKNEENEWNSHVDWHLIIVFKSSTVKWIKDILKKGDTIYVEGRLMYRDSIDKMGQKRRYAQIVVSDRDGRVEYIRCAKKHQEDSENPVEKTKSNLASQEENPSQIQENSTQ